MIMKMVSCTINIQTITKVDYSITIQINIFLKRFILMLATTCWRKTGRIISSKEELYEDMPGHWYTLASFNFGAQPTELNFQGPSTQHNLTR